MLSRPRFRSALVFIVALASGAFAFGAEPPPWRVGVARKAITPTAALWMTGYAVRDRPAEGKAQELWAKALAFQDEAGRRAVLITVDVCGVTRAMTEQVATEMEKRLSLSRSAVMVNASHTHCGPAIEGWLVGLRVPTPEEERATADYTQRLTRDLIEVATTALRTLQPATVGSAHGTATFALNRRNNPDREAAARRAAGTLRGPVDHAVPVLAARNANGELIALLASYACHNTTLNIYQWHGDYAGSAMAELERRHAGATAFFVAGCGGNINPFPRGTIELAEQHGRALADAVDGALASDVQPVRGALVTASGEVALQFGQTPTSAEIQAAATGSDAKKAAVAKQMDAAWARAMSADVARGGIQRDYPYPVQAWRLGDLTWVALGGEVVVDYALRLKAEEAKEGGAAGKLWVFGYSNDVMSYIPSESVLTEGGYEGKTSMIPYGRPSAWAPGLEDKIVGKARELVRAVNDRETKALQR